MSTEIRANDLRVGDIYQEYGDEDQHTVAIRDDHGDTVLITTSTGYERSHDIDEVVERIGHVNYFDPIDPDLLSSALDELLGDPDV